MKRILDRNKPVFLIIIAIVVLALAIYASACAYPLSQADGDNAPITGNGDSYDIERAVINTILEQNADLYLKGECQGEGHYIMKTSAEGSVVTVYALVMYGEYGFEDGNFVKVSGSGVIPTVITFTLGSDGTLETTAYQEPLDGGMYKESIERLFPVELHEQCLYPDEARIEEITAGELKYAKAYLSSINREAVIGSFGDFEHTLLTDLGVPVDVSNLMISNKKLYKYPFWVGNREQIEDGVRYIYQVEYDEEGKRIIYSKLNYDTKEAVQQLIFDSLSGKELSAS